MNAKFSALIMPAMLSAAAGLTGCTADAPGRHAQHHPASAGAPTTDEPARRDMTERCRVYREMMDAKTPQERGAMMEQRLGGMSREQMRQHMDAMREKCE